MPICGTPRRRSQYVQRRDACVRVLSVLLQHVDLVTLRVGVRGDEVLGVRLDTIAEKTGLEDRRLDRALRDLRDAGILASFERAEPDARMTRGFRGHPAVRRISEQLFAALGLAEKLVKVRAKLYRERTHKADADGARLATLRMALEGARSSQGAARRPCQAAPEGYSLAQLLSPSLIPPLRPRSA